MYVGLADDGTYKVFRTENVLYENRHKFKYCIFDCSSNLKGPVHTIVRSSDIRPLPEELMIELTVNVTNPDYPVDKVHGNKFEYDISSLSMLYSVVSNMYQYDAYNAYMIETNYELEMNDCILLEDIRVFYKKNPDSDTLVFHYYYDVTCDYMTKFLKSVNMNVVTSKVFGSKYYLILDKKGNYRFRNHIPSDAEYVGIYVDNSQSFYMLSYKQYRRFEKVESIEVSIAKKIIDVSNNIDYSLQQSSSFYELYIPFRALLVIPQYILLHSQYITNDIIVCTEICLDDGESHCITAERDEIMRTGFSLFKIIDKLTKL